MTRLSIAIVVAACAAPASTVIANPKPPSPPPAGFEWIDRQGDLALARSTGDDERPTCEDRIVRRIARRLATEAGGDDEVREAPDVLARVQAEAAATWRSPTDGRATVRGAERLHAWHEGFS
ncbi:MAG TPA: hypothetical protein VMJ10_33205, partial [Kofleriaceae bacterium]|nr:hypothetical protein [Kofleriaceae bacterium]